MGKHTLKTIALLAAVFMALTMIVPAFGAEEETEGGLPHPFSPGDDVDAVEPSAPSLVTVNSGWWQSQDGTWYYYRRGAIQTGWQKSGGSWYYLDPYTGVMVTGLAQIGNNTYYLDPDQDGAMATGWIQIDGAWYYFDDAGLMQTGWLQLDENTYYLTATGVMATGWLSFDGHRYYFSSDGVLRYDLLQDGTGATVIDTDEPMETPLYMFNVIGDFQIGGFDRCYSLENFQAALEDIAQISPETSLILTTGDITHNSTELEYKFFSAIREEMLPDVPMYLTAGNHDRLVAEDDLTDEDWLHRFRQYARMTSGLVDIDKPYYSFMAEGSYFILLGSEIPSTESEIYISAQQYVWFCNQMALASMTGKPIFVVIHEPFPNTTAGTLPGQIWAGVAAPMENNYYQALQVVLDCYPNAILFTGHTHYQLSSDATAILSDGTTANYFNAASVGYLWTDDDGGIRDATGRCLGSEGLYVYVYTDKIIIWARDFLNQEWIWQATVPLTTK